MGSENSKDSKDPPPPTPMCPTDAEKNNKPFLRERSLGRLASPYNILTATEGLSSGLSSYLVTPLRYGLYKIDPTRSTLAGLQDGGKWLFRFDQPHAGADFYHLNINPKITGVPDPHLEVSSGLVKAASAGQKFIAGVGVVAIVVGTVVNAANVGTAIASDVIEKERWGIRSTKAVTSTAAGLTLGTGGAMAGASGGAWAGAAIGTFVGPIGTAVGGFAGGIIGGLVGGLGGGVLGSLGADYVTEKVDTLISDEKQGFIFKIDNKHICIKPNFKDKEIPAGTSEIQKLAESAAFIEKQIDEWHLLVAIICTLALHKRNQVLVVTKTQNKTLQDVDVAHEDSRLILGERLRMLKINTKTGDDDNGSKTLGRICLEDDFKESRALLCTDVAKLSDLMAFAETAALRAEDKATMPAVSGEVLVMSDSGTALVWFNPAGGAIAAALELEKQLKCLEIVAEEGLISQCGFLYQFTKDKLSA